MDATPILAKGRHPSQVQLSLSPTRHASHLSAFTSNCRRRAEPASPSWQGQRQSRFGTRGLHSHEPLNPCKQTPAVLARDPRLDPRAGRQATFPAPRSPTPLPRRQLLLPADPNRAPLCRSPLIRIKRELPIALRVGFYVPPPAAQSHPPAQRRQQRSRRRSEPAAPRRPDPAFAGAPPPSLELANGRTRLRPTVPAAPLPAPLLVSF